MLIGIKYENETEEDVTPSKSIIEKNGIDLTIDVISILIIILSALGSITWIIFRYNVI